MYGNRSEIVFSGTRLAAMAAELFDMGFRLVTAGCDELSHSLCTYGQRSFILSAADPTAKRLDRHENRAISDAIDARAKLSLPCNPFYGGDI